MKLWKLEARLHHWWAMLQSAREQQKLYALAKKSREEA